MSAPKKEEVFEDAMFYTEVDLQSTISKHLQQAKCENVAGAIFYTKEGTKYVCEFSFSLADEKRPKAEKRKPENASVDEQKDVPEAQALKKIKSGHKTERRGGAGVY